MDTVLRETLPDLMERGASIQTRSVLWVEADRAASGAWPPMGLTPQPHGTAVAAAGILMAALRLEPSRDAGAAIIRDHVRRAMMVCPHGPAQA